MRKGLLQTLFTGRNLITTKSTASTNNYASELLANNEPIEGTAIMAEYQEHGRGQRGNQWISDSGSNLLVSLIFYPRFLNVRDQFYLNIFVSLAVAESLRSFGLEEISVKWPNDVYAGSSKIAGILIENGIKGSSISNSVIGIGININQIEFPDLPVKAISMAMLTGKIYDKQEVFEVLCNNLERNYLQLKNGNYAELKEKYLNHLYKKDVFQTYATNNLSFRGKIVSVNDEGKLIIENEAGLTEIYDFKEIRMLP